MNEYLNTEGGRRRRRARGVRGGRPHMQPDRPGTGWEESHIPHDDHAHGHGRRRRHRARRGAVRLAILALLAEPLNGYQIIQRLNDRTGEGLEPLTGSVYPTLSQLSDEGLIETTEDDGKRVFALTSTGVEAAERVTVAPWDSIELFGERQHPKTTRCYSSWSNSGSRSELRQRPETTFSSNLPRPSWQGCEEYLLTPVRGRGVAGLTLRGSVRCFSRILGRETQACTFEV